MYSTSVLLIIFNRPSKTKKVIDSLRDIKPTKLYVAADGPRDNNKADTENCRLTRETLKEINWDCEVKTLFREKNLGCKHSVSKALNWFFSFEEMGIILEDDIIPNRSFFIFCEEMLNRYQNDNTIGMITGSNLIANEVAISESYTFSHYANIWGWATWRRVWQTYDVNIEEWPKWKEEKNFKGIDDKYPLFTHYWKDVLWAIHNNKIDTWDFQWFFNLWKTNKLCIVPKYNLIQNIGFDHEATHTDGSIPDYITNNPAKELTLPLNHPKFIKRNELLDYATSKIIFKISFKTILKNKLRRNKYLGNFLVKTKKLLFEKNNFTK